MLHRRHSRSFRLEANIQLRHLTTFAAVADTLNFTHAAERVHLSQSSVTEQIQALEADLGTRLFDRSRRKLMLTRAGERLVAYAAELLRLAEETHSAIADAGSVVAGSLVIGGLETLCANRLPQLLAEFHRRYPAVELALKTADSGGLRSGVKSGALDIGFLFGEAKASLDIQGEAVAEDALMIVMPAGHRLAKHAMIGPESLAGEVFLVTPTGCIYRRMFDEAFAATLPASPRIIGEFASIGSIKGLVEAGLGCAMVPRSALVPARDLVVAVPWSGTSSTVPLTMIWRARRARPPATAAFLAVARESFGR